MTRDERDDQMLEVLKDIRDESRQTNTRLDGLNERVDGLNERVDGLNERVDGLGVRVDGLGDRLDQTNVRLDQTNERLQELREDLGSRIEANTERIEANSERIDANSERIDRLAGEMIKGFTGVNDRLERLDGRFERFLSGWHGEDHRQLGRRVARIESHLQLEPLEG